MKRMGFISVIGRNSVVQRFARNHMRHVCESSHFCTLMYRCIQLGVYIYGKCWRRLCFYQHNKMTLREGCQSGQQLHLGLQITVTKRPINALN
jgi:hypothetical protein